jgi:hypothetical protein
MWHADAHPVASAQGDDAFLFMLTEVMRQKTLPPEDLYERPPPTAPDLPEVDESKQCHAYVLHRGVTAPERCTCAVARQVGAFSGCRVHADAYERYRDEHKKPDCVQAQLAVAAFESTPEGARTAAHAWALLFAVEACVKARIITTYRYFQPGTTSERRLQGHQRAIDWFSLPVALVRSALDAIRSAPLADCGDGSGPESGDESASSAAAAPQQRAPGRASQRKKKGKRKGKTTTAQPVESACKKREDLLAIFQTVLSDATDGSRMAQALQRSVKQVVSDDPPVDGVHLRGVAGIQMKQIDDNTVFFIPKEYTGVEWSSSVEEQLRDASPGSWTAAVMVQTLVDTTTRQLVEQQTILYCMLRCGGLVGIGAWNVKSTSAYASAKALDMVGLASRTYSAAVQAAIEAPLHEGQAVVMYNMRSTEYEGRRGVVAGAPTASGRVPVRFPSTGADSTHVTKAVPVKNVFDDVVVHAAFLQSMPSQGNFALWVASETGLRYAAKVFDMAVNERWKSVLLSRTESMPCDVLLGRSARVRRIEPKDVSQSLNGLRVSAAHTSEMDMSTTSFFEIKLGAIEARETSRLVQFTPHRSFESHAVSRRKMQNAVKQRQDKTDAIVEKLRTTSLT